MDASVLVYAADDSSPHQAACRSWLEQHRGRPDAWHPTWNVVYEFLRVVTHQRVLRHPWTLPLAWSFVEAIIDSPGLSVLSPTERHGEVAANLIASFPELSGNLSHDMHTVVLMREHGVARICTRDADFRRFPFLEVIDPLRAQ